MKFCRKFKEILQEVSENFGKYLKVQKKNYKKLGKIF